MPSTVHWLPRGRIRPGADERLLERIRHRIYRRLCDEAGRLDLLIADLIGADLNAASTYAQLHLLAHRLGQAAAAYESPAIVQAARALEAAAVEAIERHSDNHSEPVWQAIGCLIQLLPRKLATLSLET